MDVRGSNIKSALAQLSQRCQVMIVRLTEKQIKRYTRRTLHQSQHQQQHNSNKNESIQFNSLGDSQNHRKASDSLSKKKKKRELLKELFGEDDIDELETLQSPRVCLNNSNDKVPTPKTSSLSLKRNNIFVSSAKEPVDAPPKKLKLNISTEENASNINRFTIMESLVVDDRFENNNSQKRSKRKVSTGKIRKPKFGTAKTASKQNGSNSNAVSAEEDPSIKELWSILGMESPTDRTARYFIDSNKSASAGIVPPNDSLKESNFTQVHELKGDLQSTATPQNVEAETSQKCIVQNECQEEKDEPFLTISETFSLANSSYKDVVCQNDKEKGCANNKNKSNSNINEEISSSSTIEKQQTKSPSIEVSLGQSQASGPPLLISNQERLEKCKDSTSIEPKSKIGSIRVKNIGLLVDPKLQPSNMQTAEENCQLNATACTSSSNTISTLSAEEQNVIKESFFLTYKYYFDDFVESMIPELGELLHLALADYMRFFKTVKKIEQLTSEELKREENERAKKDYEEKMRSRGATFHVLIKSIVAKFDVNSKLILFTTLFCRILQHAGTIDPANKGNVKEARKVILSMLKSHQYDEKEIIEHLDIEEKFDEGFELVNKFLDKSIPGICESTQSPTSKLQTTSHNIPAVSTSTSLTGSLNQTRQEVFNNQSAMNPCQNISVPTTSGIVNVVTNGYSPVEQTNCSAKQAITFKNQNQLAMAQKSNIPTSTSIVYQGTAFWNINAASSNKAKTGSQTLTKQNGVNNPNHGNQHGESAAYSQKNTVDEIRKTQLKLNPNIINGRHVNLPGHILQINPKSVRDMQNGRCTISSNQSKPSPLNNTLKTSNLHLVRTTVSVRPTMTLPVAKTATTTPRDLQTSNSHSRPFRLPAGTSLVQVPGTTPSKVPIASEGFQSSRSLVNQLAAYITPPPSTSVAPANVQPSRIEEKLPKVTFTQPFTINAFTSNSRARPSVISSTKQSQRSLQPITLDSLLRSADQVPTPPGHSTTTYANGPSLNSGRAAASTISAGCSRNLEEALTKLIAKQNGILSYHQRQHRPTDGLPVSNEIPATPHVIPDLGPAHTSKVGMNSGNVIAKNNGSHEENATSNLEGGPRMYLSVKTSQLAPPVIDNSPPISEVTIPSSSHCHPFIARRPISGKMRMLFS